MRANVEDRLRAVEQHPDVDTADLDYDDGEIVIMALAERVEEDFEAFLEEKGLTIRSGPKWIGFALEVVIA